MNGLVIDFHALRHTFGTRVDVLPNVKDNTVISLMRHAPRGQTYGRYVHESMDRMVAAVNALPSYEMLGEPPSLPPNFWQGGGGGKNDSQKAVAAKKLNGVSEGTRTPGLLSHSQVL